MSPKRGPAGWAAGRKERTGFGQGASRAQASDGGGTARRGNRARRLRRQRQRRDPVGSHDHAPAATSAAGPTSGAPSASGTTVTADLSEFTITLSQRTFTPGTYTFVVREQGQVTHALAIKGPGVSEQTTSIRPGGAEQRMTVTLRAGTYEIWCPVGNHKAQGMDLTITVA